MVLQSNASFSDNDIIESYCQRLPDFVRYRLDPRLLGRISSNEVVEELTTQLTQKAHSHRCSRSEGRAPSTG